ncbi:DsrE family protein [Deferribacter thermophilus]|uniref:DsrE family protein n=1 Tax=Deferribacter thermophilus TaxID=53573 RepID=UPI003C1EAAB9
MKKLMFVILIFLLFLNIGFTKEITNGGSLDNLKNVKVIFDVNVGKPKLLLLRLKLIEKTLIQIKKSGVNYEAVVAFRGGATDYITKGDHYVPKKFLEYKRKIRKQLLILKDMAVVLQQCAVAAKLKGVDLEDILDFVTVVKNGYISLIGYQNKGYALVPMD